MSEILLSFCIPTYSQPQQMRKTLDSLLCQYMGRIEIIIRDDNSDNETEKVVADYLTRLPIRYYHMTKEGIDQAFLFLSKKASGKYIWWFGDDILEKGVIERVLNFLDINPDVDFIYINSTDYSGQNFSINMSQSQFFIDRNDVINKIGDQLGFCSALLFRKNLLSLGISNSQKYIGTCWVTLFLALHVLSIGTKFYFLDGKNFISEPKLSGEQRWYDSFLVHGINFAIIVNSIRDYFDKKVIEKLLQKKFSKSWKAVIVERAMGYNTGFASAKVDIPILFALYWRYPEFYFAIIMMLMPNHILSMLYKIYKKIR